MVGPRPKGCKIFHQDQILSVMAAIGLHKLRPDGQTLTLSLILEETLCHKIGTRNVPTFQMR